MSRTRLLAQKQLARAANDKHHLSFRGRYRMHLELVGGKAHLAQRGIGRMSNRRGDQECGKEERCCFHELSSWRIAVFPKLGTRSLGRNNELPKVAREHHLCSTATAMRSRSSSTRCMC